ncbi:ABC transporter substrate-binding protein [Paracoccus seriniphilus]|uniref:Taurine transport system substrate-binding protein n=1 Tax=Paracoccus seriniphilus TaxID=184748 RepID=A0A239Q199_9RHOB|nr:ABC transporter substrate-binding protein [Paracoccus seriniphilus]WCR16100.1 ABC transporter substrate-binding protein [Paracoccus seriniphilus]SNT76284.1 taurine transport system substrate-binding protein [Paracoccus seriniphilus]
MNRAFGLATFSAFALATASGAFAQTPLTVAYFLEWPMPFQYGKVEGIYDEKLGVPVNWVAFDTGTAMSAAMAAGDVQIALSQGVPPFISAASAGQDLRVVGVAASYPENENCVVAARLEIDKDSVSELEGTRVALPVGSGAHYGFLQQMQYFGVDTGTMTIVDMAPAEGAVAFEQGDVDMACGWGGGLTRMKEHGNVLLSGAEKEQIGVLSSDLITTTSEFAIDQAELLANFMAVTEEMNAMWIAGDHRDVMLPVIAKDAGMDEGNAAAVIDNFQFPTAEEQLSETWLGGGVATYLDGVAQLFHELGRLPTVLPTYAGLIDPQPLQEVVQ